jgi:hypothetical protein
MSSSLPAIIVSRVVPPEFAVQIYEGTAKICGGVIKDLASGRILGQLVEVAGLPSDAAMANAAAVSHRFIALAKSTAALSGLTLAVSSAGFLFLTQRLAKVDARLQQVEKDVRYIRSFLEARQRAELINATNTLSHAKDARSERLREQLLIDSRQELGTLAHHFAIGMQEYEEPSVFEAAEEYFTVAALSHAQCTAELGMGDAAASEFEKTRKTWLDATRAHAKTHLLGNDPARLLGPGFTEVAGVQQIEKWMQFAHGAAASGNWIDELRKQQPSTRWWGSGPRESDRHAAKLLDRLAAHEPIMEGYAAQLALLALKNVKPSDFQRAAEQLNPADSIDSVFLVTDVEPEEKVLGV